MTRKVTDHIVDGMSVTVPVYVTDEPGPAGANHDYIIRGEEAGDDLLMDLARISFQEGPVGEHGINGITNESLLAIVIDRLEGFQSGPYACEENEEALAATQAALEALMGRTRDRLERGVEGKNES